MELSGIMNVLGGKKVIQKKIRNRMDLIELSRAGLTKDTLVHLALTFRLSLPKLQSPNPQHS